MERSNGLRIIKNTGSLYVRTIVLTLISLFTVRVVLNALGASDYGVYNVVGGFVTMFTFISGSLSISSQRYFAIHLASDDWDKVNHIFSVNIVIYLLFISIIFIIAETFGTWFVINQLNFESSRVEAAMVVYQTSVITFLIGVMASPFQALLIADENLSVYSMLSIVEGILKVIVSYMLYVIDGDKLIIYACLTMLSSCAINISYFIYVKRKYKKLRFAFCTDRNEYKNVFSYLSWNLIGSVAAVLKGQGVNIIINIFFGTTINAARGVASQVNNTIVSFSQNFMKAVDPQITKAYAAGDKDGFSKIIHMASKISFSLLFIVAMPLIFNSNYVLTLWLKDIPDYTEVFTVLVLVDALVASITDPILTGVQATGKVKMYQIVIGGLNLLNLPVSYILLRLFENPLIPFGVAISISILMGLGRMLIFKRIYDYEILRYISKVIIRMVVVAIVSSIVTRKYLGASQSFFELVIKVIGSTLLNLGLLFGIGLDRNEKETLIHIVSKKSFNL